MQDVCSDADMLALLQAARAGDSAAYDRLYNLYADRVFRYLYARLGQREMAEDLTADVFVRLLQNLPRFRVNNARPVASFSAFVYRVAGNLLTDQYRKQKHRDHQDIDDQPHLADWRPEPLAETTASENCRELMNAMCKLGAEQQAVLLYRFSDEFSVLEVAEIMGKTTGAIKALQHRAIANLRRILSSEATA
jgi:RNA polymerase sigma-70 factor (ECF subfamily)